MRGHGKLSAAILGSVSRACTHDAKCLVVVIQAVSSGGSWDPDEAVAREIAENAVTWKALTRLGVRSETELSLEFVSSPEARPQTASWLSSCAASRDTRSRLPQRG